jgi:protein TonB
MGTTPLTRSSMDEIVFEHRNKNYGAYRIRQGYDAALLKSFGIAMLALMSLAMTYRFMPTKTEPPVIRIDSTQVTPVVLEQEKIKPIAEQVKPSLPPSKPLVKNDIPLVPLVVDSTHEEPVKPEVAEHTPGPEAPSDHSNGTGTGITDTGTGKHPADEDPGVALEPTVAPDVNPEFPGGEEALRKYLQKNIQYTQFAIDAHVNGKMIVQFVVDEQGNIKDVKVVKKLGFGLEKLAVEIINGMPKWHPGLIKGKPVPVLHMQRISYQME